MLRKLCFNAICNLSVLLVGCGGSGTTQSTIAAPPDKLSAPQISSANLQTNQSNKMNREKLAEQIEKTDANTAATIRNEKNSLEQVPTPFLKRGAVYCVTKFTPTRPVKIFIGSNEADFTAVLNANADAFAEFAASAGLLLDKRQLRLSYVQTYLEIVYSPAKRFQILQNINELEERPNLDIEGKQRFQAINVKYEKTIVAPQATDAVPYHATIFAVHSQNLVKLDLTIEHDGKITVQETILEKDLPIPYAL